MHMLGDDQRGEHVRVERRGHSSSSNERTSSGVTTVPTLTRGSPVLGSMEIASVLAAPRWLVFFAWRWPGNRALSVRMVG